MKRLEELKRIQEEYPVGGDQWGNGVGEDDVDWLIEQLEDANKEIADRENSHIELYNRMVEAEDKAYNLEKKSESTYDALLMCRSILQFYANEENYTYQEREIKWGESITHFKHSEIEKDWGSRARKLLEGEIL